MLNKNLPLILKTLSVAACLALAAPAYASNDKNHDKNHASDHDKNHDSDHDRHTSRSKSSSTAKFSRALVGVDELRASGKIKLEQASKKTEFEAEVKVPVPSASLSLDTLAEATGATLTLYLTDATGADYAECDFDLSKTEKSRKRGVISYSAEYKIKLTNRNGYLQEKAGVCDIDLTKDGIQPGIPTLKAGDTAQVGIDTNNAIVAETRF